jgi:hypothetical protein
VCPVERSANVCELAVQSSEQLRVLVRRREALDVEWVTDVVRRMTPADLFGLATLLEAFERILADRLEHPVASLTVFLPAPHKALVEQRLQRVGIYVADGFSCFERARSPEDGQPAKQLPLVGKEQLVRPLDRRAQRLLAWVEITRSFEQIETSAEAIEQLTRREEDRPGCGQLESERELVEPLAELFDLGRRRDLGADGGGT